MDRGAWSGGRIAKIDGRVLSHPGKGFHWHWHHVLLVLRSWQHGIWLELTNQSNRSEKCSLYQTASKYTRNAFRRCELPDCWGPISSALFDGMFVCYKQITKWCASSNQNVQMTETLVGRPWLEGWFVRWRQPLLKMKGRQGWTFYGTRVRV